MDPLNKWFYGGVNLLKNQEFLEDLELVPQKYWLKKHYVSWLTICRLNSEGFVDDVKDRVKAYMLCNCGPPPILKILLCPTIDIFPTTQTLSRMISHIMIKEVNTSIVHKADKRIIFLFLI